MRGVLGAVAIALVALTASAGATGAARCDDRAGRTVFADRHLRIFQRVAGSGDETTLRVLACAPGTRSARLLERRDNTLDETSRVISGARAGTFPVVEYTVEGGVAIEDQLVEYGARSATRLARIAVDEDGSPATYVVTRGGGIAILAGGRVVAFDDGGRRALGAGASDLAAAGDRVYWTEDGAPHAATLNGHPHGDLSG
jgi:hypothetical protein